MTVKEFRRELDILDRKAKHERRALFARYAEFNNKVEVGDLFTDHIGTIKVDSMQVATPGYNTPCMAYTGVMMTAKGVPCKSGICRTAWQCNAINEDLR